MNRRLVAYLKVTVVVAIIAFLIADHRLSLQPLVMASPATWLVLVALQIVILMMGVVRWWLILRAIEGGSTSYRQALAYTWIGQFFGCVAPSAVATDVTRYRCLKADRDGSGPAILTSFLLDRMAGVIGICALAFVFSSDLVSRVIVAAGVWILVGVAVLVLVAWVALRRRLADPIERAGVALRAAAASPGTMVFALAASFGAHALKVVSLWVVVSASDISVPQVFHLAPVGFLVEALPLAFGGLGTAHLAFDKLFELEGVAGGAALFNVYFVTRILVSSFGGVLWIVRRRA